MAQIFEVEELATWNDFCWETAQEMNYLYLNIAISYITMKSPWKIMKKLTIIIDLGILFIKIKKKYCKLFFTINNFYLYSY